MKYTIDITGLTNYLERLKESDFQNSDGRSGTNPYGIIKAARLINEIESLKLDKSKITLDTVILHGMPFLCDFLGNDLSIVELKKGKRYCKFISTLIHNCHKEYGTALNGYWVIPDKFIKYEQ